MTVVTNYTQYWFVFHILLNTGKITVNNVQYLWMTLLIVLTSIGQWCCCTYSKCRLLQSVIQYIIMEFYCAVLHCFMQYCSPGDLLVILLLQTQQGWQFGRDSSHNLETNIECYMGSCTTWNLSLVSSSAYQAKEASPCKIGNLV
jgi:hypothetical protein